MKLHSRIALTAAALAAVVTLGPVVAQTITALTAGAAVSGADLFESVQSGNSRKVTATQLRTWATAALAAIASSGSASDLSTGTVPAGRMPALTGDVTTGSGAVATTLATVNSNVGTFGSSTACVTFTANGKGLITAASSATCTPAVGSVTGFGTGVATALAVNTGSAGAFIVNGGAGGTPSSLTCTNCSGTAASLTAGTVTTNANLTGVVTSVGNATSFAASPTFTGTVSDGIGDVRTIVQNSKSAAYTTVLTDCGKHIWHPDADTTARTITIDSNANVAAPLGCATTLVNGNGSGVVTLSITTDTLRLSGGTSTGSRTIAANCVVTWIKVTTTVWYVSGGSCLT